MKNYLIISLLYTSVLSAQIYDPGFNGNGFVTGPDFYSGSNQIETPSGLTYEISTDKILFINEFNPTGFNIHRLNNNGTHDMSFGEEGVGEFFIESSSAAMDIYTHGDGYMVAGQKYPDEEFFSPFLENITGTGTINTDYGTDGILIATAAQSILISATCKDNSDNYYLSGYDHDYDLGFGIAKFNADGLYDTDFGYRTYNLAQFTIAECMTSLADGRIVVAGNVTYLGSEVNAFITCLNSDGTLDESFGTDGSFYPTPLLENTGLSFQAIKQAPDGSIYAAGWISSTPDKLIVIKINDQGVIETEFGDQGYVYLEEGTFYTIFGLEVDASNQPIIGFVTHPDADATINTYLVKLLTNGSLDESFTSGATPGVFEISIPDALISEEIVGTKMMLQPDGKIVVLGHAEGISPNDDYFITRIVPNDVIINVEEEISEMDVTISPNPVTSKFTISANTVVQEMEIWNTDGKILLKSNNIQQNTQFDIKNYAPGMYIVKIKGIDGNITFSKLIKQ
ncbi:MAG: T9SS type A sorting domain-containing protein [Chitinophagales bacterium]|nr:T9SS type A sorting domain-containing protein [Bacteroidota bacterium]MBK7568511.1 T9SS type A sorting domain-containing protein [Bacteroidota bacterium]MBP8916461.1 T9SS type A sorting domain-containing protein [Chitinophagales bacterium]MBP9220549.1 T9SS type A sorting domain-containing protein [Chitinophagales bacterium]MBP9795858.1 T9SS type A sorting domain-containing protein [Chitinophagales bacterium]